MKIRTKQDFKLAGQVGKASNFPQGIYGAINAVNQPNWIEEGKVFIHNEYGNDLLLTQEDYEVIRCCEKCGKELPVDASPSVYACTMGSGCADDSQKIS